MRDFFIEGGYAMYPVLALGVVLVWAAARYARDGEPVRLRFIIACALALAVAAVHGTWTDVKMVLFHLADESRVPDAMFARVLVTGLKESTGPVVLASALGVLAAILVCIGVYRVGRRELKAARG